MTNQKNDAFEEMMDWYIGKERGITLMDREPGFLSARDYYEREVFVTYDALLTKKVKHHMPNLLFVRTIKDFDLQNQSFFAYEAVIRGSRNNFLGLRIVTERSHAIRERWSPEYREYKPRGSGSKGTFGGRLYRNSGEDEKRNALKSYQSFLYDELLSLTKYRLHHVTGTIYLPS